MPGTTFSSVAERGTYDSAGRATMTLAELEIWLAWQIAGVYHLRPHSALRCTPLDAWQKGIERMGKPPREPSDPKAFHLDFLPFEKRLVGRAGLRRARPRGLQRKARPQLRILQGQAARLVLGLANLGAQGFNLRSRRSLHLERRDRGARGLQLLGQGRVVGGELVHGGLQLRVPRPGAPNSSGAPYRAFPACRSASWRPPSRSSGAGPWRHQAASGGRPHRMRSSPRPPGLRRAPPSASRIPSMRPPARPSAACCPRGSRAWSSGSGRRCRLVIGP